MAEILTLDDAQAALRSTGDNVAAGDDIETTYIPATTVVVEGIVGPVMARTGLTQTFLGGTHSVLLLNTAITGVTSITVAGTTLDPSTYAVDLESGIIHSYTAIFGYQITQSVVVAYTVGAYATPDDVPPAIKLAARIILAHLWQVDQQGFRPTFGGPEMGTMSVGIGYAIPNRAAELLAPFVTSWGFA